MKNSIHKLFLLFTLIMISSTAVFSQFLWEKYEGNPLMIGGEEGNWDNYVFQPMVLYNDDSTRYEMYYSGSTGNPLRPFSIGVAYSPDGISWTPYPGNPVLTPDPFSWDEETVETPWVLRINGVYKMWYYGGKAGKYEIGYAESSDGINWEKSLENPVFTVGVSSWENYAIVSPSVYVNDAGKYTMYYTGWPTDWRSKIGRAFSNDGYIWIRDTLNPIFEYGQSGQWDEEYVQGSPILNIHDTLYFWYFGAFRGGYNGVGLGQASSTDNGASWTRSADNPIIEKTPLSWNEKGIEYPFALLKSDSVYLYYGGWGTHLGKELWRIGLAKARIPALTNMDQNSIVPADFFVANNYPNPFNPVTSIKYSIPVESRVSLRIYDIIGNEVAVLVNEATKAGSYKTTWDAGNMASGVYFYQFRAGDFVQTKKMILMK